MARSIELIDRPTVPEVKVIGVTVFDPVWAARRHRTHGHELLHVVRGRMHLETDGAPVALEAQDTALVPAGTMHRDRFDTDLGLEVLYCAFAWDDAPRFFEVVDNPTLLASPHAGKVELARQFDLLRSQLGRLGRLDRLVVRSRLLTLLMLIYRRCALQKGLVDDDAHEGTTPERHLVARTRELIDRRYGETLSLEQIAEAVGVSPWHLSHVFSRTGEQSLFAYLTTVRIDKARALLTETSMNVSEVAYAVGYDDPNYFSKVFRKVTGKSPTGWRGRSNEQ